MTKTEKRYYIFGRPVNFNHNATLLWRHVD